MAVGMTRFRAPSEEAARAHAPPTPKHKPINHEVRHRPHRRGVDRHRHRLHRHPPPINKIQPRLPRQWLFLPRDARASMRPPRQDGQPQGTRRHLLSQTYSQSTAGEFTVEEVLFG